MIKFQGRSSLKKYMPQKPIKRGIKVWVLADSRNGYFSRLEVYTGRKRNTEHGLGEIVVKDLTLDFGIGFVLTTFLYPKKFFVIWKVWASMDVEQRPQRLFRAIEET